MGRRWGPYPHDYASLLPWLKKSRINSNGHVRRVLPGKRCTEAQFLEVSGAIGITYQCTTVVALYPDGGIQLNSGGYRTATTKARMNEWLPHPYTVWQHKRKWYLGLGWLHREGKRDVHLKVPFEDHMVVNPDACTATYLNGIVVHRDALILRYVECPDDFVEVEFETGPTVPAEFMRFAPRLEVD